MEILTSPLANASARRETMHGRNYIVAPMSLIVPGVLNGSMGPLFYPPEETASSADSWNGMPIVVYHPRKDGRHVSARSPQVMVESNIGTVYNATFDRKLGAEGWFDEELVKNADRGLPDKAKILPRLLKGEPIELSTGLFTENESAPPGSVFNGQQYTHVARKYRPDHLAVLPDLPGACSIADGCGVMVNAKTDSCGDTCDCTACTHQRTMKPSKGDATMNEREKAVEFLVANCDCWKDAEGKTTLNALSTEKVLALKADAEKKIPVANTTSTASTSAVTPVVVAPVAKPAVNACADNEDGEVTGSKKKKATMNEWMASAPPEVQVAVNTALELVNAEKANLIANLTANVADTIKASLATQLSGYGVPELRNLLALRGQVQNAQSVIPEFNGMRPAIYAPATAGGVVNNSNDPVEEGPAPPTINWKASA